MPGPLPHKELSYHYKFFGLVFHSNRCLPGIPLEENTPEKSDLTLHLGFPPFVEPIQPVSQELTYVSSDTNGEGRPLVKIWKVQQGDFVRMKFCDDTEFWLDRSHENIWAIWPSHMPFENATCYLLGPVLGLLLRLRGITCLHASAVNLEGRGVAFVGTAGAGKSTIAAAFARDGHPVLSDDIVPLVERDGSFLMIPAYPHLSLWPDSVDMLYGSPDALPRFVPGREKRCLFLGEKGTGAKFESRPLPLAAIYILGERRPGATAFVEAVPSPSALLSLLADTYGNKVLDRERRAQEFELLGRLTAAVPVRRVFFPADTAFLTRLCEVVHRDLASLDIPTAVRP